MTARNIVIVMGRCTVSKQGVGFRFERRGPDQWAGTWAFPIKEEAAKREGYERTRMDGRFTFEPGFPGCPHCAARNFWLCVACGKLACWNGETRWVVCPSCGQGGVLSGEATSMLGGGDR